MKLKFLLSTLLSLSFLVSLLLSFSGNISYGEVFDVIKFYIRNVLFTYILFLDSFYLYTARNKRKILVILYIIVLVSFVKDFLFMLRLVDPDILYKFTILEHKEKLSGYYIRLLRAPGILGNSNFSANFLILLMFFRFILSKSNDFIFVGIIFSNLLMLGSRTNFILFFSVLFYQIFALYKDKPLKAFLVNISIFGILFIIIYLSIAGGLASSWILNYYNNLLFQKTYVDSSLEFRLNFFWHNNIEKISSSPIFGKFLPEDAAVTDGEFFFILGSLGLVGFVLYLSFILVDILFLKTIEKFVMVSFLIVTLTFSGVFFVVIGSINLLYLVVVYSLLFDRFRIDSL